MSRGEDLPAALPPHVLRDYALLADGERGALVGPRGDITWMCGPHWDSGAVFSSMIGGSGFYAVTPDERFTWGGYYEEGSLIWRSRWITTRGITECREALAYPGDARTAVLLRRIEAVAGPARFRIRLDLRADFGRHQMSDLVCGPPAWTARSGPLYLRWSGSSDARQDDGGALEFVLELAPGERHDLVPEISDRALDDPVDASRAWKATEAAWSAAVPGLGASLAPHESRHSYAVLTGLTSAGGGMVAAAPRPRPSGPGRGVTTTTGTCGHAISATPGRRWPLTGLTSSWTTRSRLWPRASWPTGLS